MTLKILSILTEYCVQKLEKNSAVQEGKRSINHSKQRETQKQITTFGLIMMLHLQDSVKRGWQIKYMCIWYTENRAVPLHYATDKFFKKFLKLSKATRQVLMAKIYTVPTSFKWNVYLKNLRRTWKYAYLWVNIHLFRDLSTPGLRWLESLIFENIAHYFPWKASVKWASMNTWKKTIEFNSPNITT